MKKTSKDTIKKAVQKKIAVLTTFPNWATDVYAKQFIESFCKYFPKEVHLLISFDEGPEQKHSTDVIAPIIDERLMNKTAAASTEFLPEQREFLNRHKDIKPQKDYRFNYVRFSYKPFALENALAMCKEMDYDYIVWMDADIEVKKEVTMEKLIEWLPDDNQAVSYLGRQDWDHSECGFMAFNVKNGGSDIINKVFQMYVKDEVLTLEQWHDSFVFDTVWKDLPKKNLTEGKPGRDIFEVSPLAEYMVHYKGKRKLNKLEDIPEFRAKTHNSDQMFGGKVYDVGSLPIKTKNCQTDDTIINNITMNMKQINKWIEICKETDEEIVICSAGESLNPWEIRKWYDKGVKIVAVKHAMEKLLAVGIKPWMCILLDPREHVKKFVQDAPQETIFMVSSMVNPEVVQILNKRKCRVIGYHAHVSAGEEKIVPIGSYLILGGSATSTRGINVLYTLGFRNMHLYGYDLSVSEKPDLTQKKENGKPMWEEITISEQSYGDQTIKRTFWTKGEFLAQAQEFKIMYLPMKSLKLHTYGDVGMIPWIHRHIQLKEQWHKDVAEKQDSNAKNVNEWLDDYRCEFTKRHQGWPQC